METASAPSAANTPNAPTAPFTDARALHAYFQTRIYNKGIAPDAMFPAIIQLYKLTSMEEMMALPTRTNSGKVGTMASSWLGLMPFVDLSDQWVYVDNVFISDDGYTVGFFGRWNGGCNADLTLPAGDTIALKGKRFENLAYSYKLTFDRETGKASSFHGILDQAEWGRLMGSPEYSIAAAKGLIPY